MRRPHPPTRWPWMLVLLTGCATYEPAPIDRLRLLAELDDVSVSLDGVSPPGAMNEATVADPRGVAMGPRELAAFAVSHHPELAAVRREIGVRSALLVEAGLLPDPEIGWDGMDFLAATAVEGTATEVDILSGFGLMFPLLRPDERDAKREVAAQRVEETRSRVAAAEWRLTRDIYVVYGRVVSAEELAAQMKELMGVVASTNDYFTRARTAGAATAIEANLALSEVLSLRLETLHAETQVEQHRQELNALLGLPPATRVELRRGDDPASFDALDHDLEWLTSHAVEHRPDLAELSARYRAADEEVRLAVATQYPQVAIGTGIEVTLPLFSRFGAPAIDTAMATRDWVGAELSAAIHEVRREVAAAHQLWEGACREVEVVESELLPNAEHNLELCREAFSAGEVTLLETLALQRALVEARTKRTEVRAERSLRAWSLLAASGCLLGLSTSDEIPFDRIMGKDQG